MGYVSVTLRRLILVFIDKVKTGKIARRNTNIDEKMKIAVAGTGYVGLSLCVLLAQHHQVYAVDIIRSKVDFINNRRSPI